MKKEFAVGDKVIVRVGKHPVVGIVESIDYNQNETPYYTVSAKLESYEVESTNWEENES